MLLINRLFSKIYITLTFCGLTTENTCNKKLKIQPFNRIGPTLIF